MSSASSLDAGRTDSRVSCRADLHVHSTLSDGVETPAELLRLARGRLGLLSICDHDTIAAYVRLAPASIYHPARDSEARLTAHEPRVLPGIEVSARFEGEEIHLLGYFPRGFPAIFERWVQTLEDDRRARIREGVEALRRRGIELRWSTVDDQVGEGVPCRSHLARALIRMGVARSPAVIFRRYLCEGFAPPRVAAAEVIDCIRAHGGIAVWAHPSLDEAELHAARLAAEGLQGIEARLPRRRPAEVRRLLEVASRHDLITTGGSDHHGLSRRHPLGSFGIEAAQLPRALLGQSTTEE